MDRRMAMVLLLAVGGCSAVKPVVVKPTVVKPIADGPKSSISNVARTDGAVNTEVKNIGANTDPSTSTNLTTNPNANPNTSLSKIDPADFSELKALLQQHAEILEQQRDSILELQQQREHMQKQLIALTSAANKNAIVVTPQSSHPLKAEAVAHSAQLDSSGKQILGQFEWAWFDLFGDSVNARIDTGAKFSKLFAAQVQVFERNGSSWVRFSLSATWQGASTSDRTFEAPLARKVKVKVKATETTPVVHRPVIKLTTRVGAIVEEIEFVVHQKNPSNEGVPVLLGRSFVRDLAVVDVAQQHTQKKFIKAVSP